MYFMNYIALNKSYVVKYSRFARSQNEMVLKKFFHEDACIRWHNTNEQFNVTEFLRANCEYPGDWSGEVERIEKTGNTVTTEHMYGQRECLFM